MGIYDPIQVTPQLENFLKTHQYPYDSYTQIRVINFMLSYIRDQGWMQNDPETLVTFVELDVQLQTLFQTSEARILYSQVGPKIKQHLIK